MVKKRYLQQISSLFRTLTKPLAYCHPLPIRSSNQKENFVRLLTLFDFLYEAELDHQISSLPRLLKYMTDSQICRKLQVIQTFLRDSEVKSMHYIM